MMKWLDDEKFADKTAEKCLEKYRQLPKKGKPQKDVEWTLLAGVIIATEAGNDYELNVVSLGTGSKCIGQSKMSREGTILNDSHAEVIARRAFICYLYYELLQVYKGELSPVFTFPTAKSDRKVKVRNNVSFHFFTSHTPCGDASIFAKQDSKSGGLPAPASQLPPLDSEQLSPPCCHSENLGHTKLFQDNQSNNDSVKNNLIKDNTENLRRTAPCDNSNNADLKRKLDCSAEETEYEVKRRKDLSQSVNEELVQSGSLANSFSQGIESKRDTPFSTDVGNDIVSAFPQERDNNNKESNVNENVTKEVCCQTKNCHTYVLDSNEAVHNGQTDHVKSEPKGALESNLEKTVVPNSVANDIYRTGAKCVPGDIQDALGQGEDYHRVGAFRTKPGRGERTLSVACSDKLAKWNVLGCQGAILMHFLEEPVYFESFIIGRCPYSEEAMKRAVVRRSEKFNPTQPYDVHQPKFLQSSLQFDSSREVLFGDSEKGVPSPAAVGWFTRPTTKGWAKKKSTVAIHDVTVNGRKQGTTVKDQHKPASWSVLCSRQLFSLFVSLKESVKPEKLPPSLRDTNLKTYKDFKMASSSYQSAREELLKVFGTWVHKPDGFLDFTASTYNS